MRLPQLLTASEKRLAGMLFLIALTGTVVQTGRHLKPEEVSWLDADKKGTRPPGTAPGKNSVDSSPEAAGTLAVPIPGTSTEAANREIDPNRASTAELVSLPGVGPVLAARIVEYRAQNGPFREPEDLLRVQGIGPATLLRIRARLRFP